MKIARFSLVLAAAALCMGACGPGAGGSALVVRDSAGVRIVENHALAAGETRVWHVNDQPVLQIGVADGAPEYQLSDVRGAVRLAGGAVVVANGHSRELRFYDAQGRHLRSAGGAGGGPGEFQTLDAVVAYRRDSLAVWDSGPRRLSIFGSDGGFGRAATVSGLTSVTARLRAAFDDGSLVLEPTGTPEDYRRMVSGERRDSVAFLRVAADGAVTDTLARRAAREYVSVRSGNVILQRPVLFGRNSYVAAGEDRIFVGESDGFRIDVVNARGAALMSIRRRGGLRPVGRQDLARARAESEQGRQRARGEMAAIAGTALPDAPADEIPARSTLPAFDRVLVDQQGYLWVRDFVVSASNAPRWSVFDAEGRWVASVQTPAGVEIYQIGPDWVLGRGRDDLDVEYVRVYPLRRGGSHRA